MVRNELIAHRMSGMTSKDMLTVGDYHLGQGFADIEGDVAEAEPLEYAAVDKMFDDERIYHGQTVSWIGLAWDIVLGVTGGRIYKICLTDAERAADFPDAYDRAYAELTRRFGSPSEELGQGAHLAWDQPWGNVVLSYRAIGEFESLSVAYTWSEPFRGVSRGRGLSSLAGLRFVMPIFSREFRARIFPSLSDEEKALWCQLRAIEWAEWPLFVTQPVIPILLALMPWWQLLVGILILSWVWPLVRTSFVSVSLLRIGVHFVRLRWPVSIGMAAYLAVSGRYWLAVLAVFWPIVAVVLQILTPPPQLSRVSAALVMRLFLPANRAERQAEDEANW